MKLIFIPGALSTTAIWGGLNRLRETYTVIDADVISFDKITDMADNIVQKINIQENYCVIGISMGGYVAIDLACRNLPCLKKLILINTTAKSVDLKTLHYRKAAMNLAKNEGLQALLSYLAGTCFYDYTKEMISIEKAMASEISVESYLKQQEAIITRKNYEESLGLIRADTLVISTKVDRILPFSDSIDLHTKIENSKFISFAKCGHLPTLEKSHETYFQVAHFINS